MDEDEADESAAGPVTDGGSINDICGNGLDDDGDGRADEGCICELGKTQKCFLGSAAHAGKGACVFGTQVCARTGSDEFGRRWGACQGAGRASTEKCSDGIDNDCDGKTDCSDPECANSTACLQKKCSGGQVLIHDLWYCYANCPGGTFGLATVPGWGASCPGTYGKGGWLKANCPGKYKVCGVLKRNPTGETCRESCVTVTVTKSGQSVALSPFPGFTACNACATGLYSGGGYTCIRVSGTTNEGIAVNKMVYCGWYFCSSNDPSCKGSSSGGGSMSGGGTF